MQIEPLISFPRSSAERAAERAAELRRVIRLYRTLAATSQAMAQRLHARGDPRWPRLVGTTVDTTLAALLAEERLATLGEADR